MKHLLRFYGLDPDRDVTMLNAGDMPARWAAIQSGRADAAVFTVGDVVQAKDLGLKVLAQAADVVDIPENGVAVADGKLADRPDQVKAMLNAMIDEGLRQTIDAEKSAAGITRDVPPDEVASFELLQEVLRERAARR